MHVFVEHFFMHDSQATIDFSENIQFRNVFLSASALALPKKVFNLRFHRNEMKCKQFYSIYFPSGIQNAALFVAIILTF